MKKQTTLLLGLALMMSLVSCSESADNGSTPDPSNGSEGSASNTAEASANDSNQEDFFWQLAVIKAERTQNLANTQSFTLYGGDIEDVDYSAAASEGHEFLILELSIDKAGAGGSPFSWEDLYVLDSDGNQFFRMENDKFLEDYNLPRLNGTSLTLGGQEGFICLEIPTASGALQLVHETEEGQNIINL